MLVREPMTPAELARVRRRLVAFAAEVFELLPRADQRRWGECCLRGLMVDGKRKSVQPMAVPLPDGNERALQQFVGQSPWDWRPVHQRLATEMTAVLDPDAWLIDDTGFPEHGNASVGVARQHLGTLGKVANCQVEVSIHAATGQGELPDRLAAVPARELGPGCCAATRVRGQVLMWLLVRAHMSVAGQA
jgi:SRSO17 transposase